MNIWSILGISVAVVAAFCITVLEAFQDKRYYEDYKWHACALLLIAGFVTLVLGFRRRPRSKTNEDEDSPAGNPDDEELEELSFNLTTGTYWGAMLIALGICLICIVPRFSASKAVEAPVKVVQKTNEITNAIAVAPPVTITNPAPPGLTFPDVQLQGIIFNPTNPLVIIQGKTFGTGEYVEDARISAITQSNITLEILGHRRVIPMGF